MKTKIAIFLAVMAFCCLPSKANGKYRMKFPEPIECMDTDKNLGQNAFGYYNLNDEDGSTVLQIGYQYENAYPFNPDTGLARIVSGGKFGFDSKLLSSISISIIRSSIKPLRNFSRIFS